MKTRDGLTPKQKAAQILFSVITEELDPRGAYAERNGDDDGIDERLFDQNPAAMYNPKRDNTPAVKREVKKQYKKLAARFLLRLERIAGLEHTVPIDDWKDGKV